MAPRSLSAISFALATTALLAAAPARAEDSAVDVAPPATKAEELYDRARALLAAGRFGDAAPLFAESYALDPQVGPLLNLALCYEVQRRTASAWRIWLQAAEAAEERGEGERATYARQRAQELEPTLLRVKITVAPQATLAAIAVALDHAPLARERWGTTIALDEGVHEITAAGSGLQPWSSRFVVAPDHVPSVVVPELAPEASAAAPPPGTPPPGRAGSWLRTLAWPVGGVGVAALGVGAAFGVAGIVNRSSAMQDHDCVLHMGISNCTPAGANDLSRARDELRIADVSYAVGGGLLITAAAFWLFGHGWPGDSASAARVRVQPDVARGLWSVAVDGDW